MNSSDKCLISTFNAVQRGALGFDMIDMTWLTALLIGAGCFALGCLIGARHSSPFRLSTPTDHDASKKKNRGKQPLEVEKLADIIHDFKMVLFISAPFYLCMYVSLLRDKATQGLSLSFCVQFSSVVCDDCLQVLVVRNDLKMGKGKIAAQCR